jgi:hypothetical protein
MCWLLLILGVCVCVCRLAFSFGWQDGGLWRLQQHHSHIDDDFVQLNPTNIFFKAENARSY